MAESASSGMALRRRALDIGPGVVRAINYVAAAVVDPRVPASLPPVWLTMVDLLGADIPTGDLAEGLRLVIESGNADADRPRAIYDYMCAQASVAALTGCGRSAHVWAARAEELTVEVREQPGTLLLISHYTSAASSDYQLVPRGGDPEWFRVLRLIADPEHFLDVEYSSRERPFELQG